MGSHNGDFFSGRADEGTQPLPTLGALAFQLFLHKHGLSILDVALAAQVRLLTVWRISRGLPVSSKKASMVRDGIYRLTRVIYRGLIVVRQETSDK